MSQSNGSLSLLPNNVGDYFGGGKRRSSNTIHQLESSQSSRISADMGCLLRHSSWSLVRDEAPPQGWKPKTVHEQTVIREKPGASDSNSPATLSYAEVVRTDATTTTCCQKTQPPAPAPTAATRDAAARPRGSCPTPSGISDAAMPKHASTGSIGETSTAATTTSSSGSSGLDVALLDTADSFENDDASASFESMDAVLAYVNNAKALAKKQNAEQFLAASQALYAVTDKNIAQIEHKMDCEKEEIVDAVIRILDTAKIEWIDAMANETNELVQELALEAATRESEFNQKFDEILSKFSPFGPRSENAGSMSKVSEGVSPLHTIDSCWTNEKNGNPKGKNW